MENIRNEVLKYIKDNWMNSVRPANERVPYPFTSPSISGMYKDFFYWDTYFINQGLLLDGFDEQVKNNLDNFVHSIETLGYIPNATDLNDRTQPPLFSRCVYEYYEYKKDINIIKHYLPYILKEYNFFMTKRLLPCGLNSFMAVDCTDEDIMVHYRGLSPRVLEFSDDPDTQRVIGKDIIAIAESGLDFNMRFRTKESKISAHAFIHLDLNCFLYDVELKIAKMFEILGDEDNKNKFISYAKKRKDLVNKYLFCKEKGIYLDYNFEDDTFSEIASVVSFYPYCFGLSDDKEGALKLIKLLELPYGISPCAYRGDDVYFQFDYPMVWPYTSWFTFNALRNIGLKTDADRIATKYMSCVENNFVKTNRIWEKYDGRDGSIGVSFEYETPEMLGWSAGVYRFFSTKID